MSDTMNYTYPQGVTPADVWATLQEAGRKIQEVAASQKETEKIIKETNASLRDTEKLVKEIGKRHGDFTNRFGEMVEYMVAPNLQDKFSEMGLDFQEVSNDVKMKDKKNNIFFQIDVYLQNNDMGMLVEVKADLTIGDINNHIERLEKMRSYANLRGDKRVFLGAVAGVVIKDDARAHALQQGLYLVEPSGQTFNITTPHNKPKEW